ncbi:hypothetical protein KIH74_22650 [Kineosporia sp. J2-2]|uniref:DUF317 domain-containing protein n=1 Tax=Kineosporia corallincola TaxID=2835133 RepID=A0ABS5TLN5_9ACTN|nr:hypothetical protein [Kineosporia corallincola]MBT0771758.1 hypothetical protein [Kineosporia corallincola]
MNAAEHKAKAERIWAVVRNDATPATDGFYHRVYLPWDLPDWAEPGDTAESLAKTFAEEWPGRPGTMRAVELTPAPGDGPWWVTTLAGDISSGPYSTRADAIAARKSIDELTDGEHVIDRAGARA